MSQSLTFHKNAHSLHKMKLKQNFRFFFSIKLQNKPKSFQALRLLCSVENGATFSSIYLFNFNFKCFLAFFPFRFSYTNAPSYQSFIYCLSYGLQLNLFGLSAQCMRMQRSTNGINYDFLFSHFADDVAEIKINYIYYIICIICQLVCRIALMYATFYAVSDIIIIIRKKSGHAHTWQTTHLRKMCVAFLLDSVCIVRKSPWIYRAHDGLSHV